MPKIIHPESMSLKDSKKLFEFFEAQAKLGICIWKNGETYHFADNTPFVFPSLVIRRKRKTDSGVRYEFLSDKLLGQGSFGLVFEIAGTLVLESDKMSYKQVGFKNKARVVKVEKHLLKDPSTVVTKEYVINKLMPHLSTKEPVIFGNSSYSVMRKLKGKELFDILTDDLGGYHYLTYHKRIKLTCALLNALKEQVTDKGLIHRDLKPENIIVNLAEPIEVNIIDFGLSVFAKQLDGTSSGTLTYAAPEAFSGGLQTVKMDVFSMGRILALLWHVDTASYSSNLTDKQCIQNANNINLNSLFKNISDMPYDVRYPITQTLQEMMNKYQSKRLSIEDAIAIFEYLLAQNPIIRNTDRHSSSHDLDISRKESLRLILNQIDVLEKKAVNLRKLKQNEASRTLLSLTKYLKGQMEFLTEMTLEDYNKNVLSVAQFCQKPIAKTNAYFQTHIDLKHLLVNLALAIAGLGVIYIAAATINKVVTGNFTFFNSEKTPALLNTVKQHLDQLNSPDGKNFI